MDIKIGDIVKSDNYYTKVYHIGYLEQCAYNDSIWGYWVRSSEEARNIVYNKDKEHPHGHGQGGRLAYTNHAVLVSPAPIPFVPVSRREARRILYEKK